MLNWPGKTGHFYIPKIPGRSFLSSPERVTTSQVSSSFSPRGQAHGHTPDIQWNFLNGKTSWPWQSLGVRATGVVYHKDDKWHVVELHLTQGLGYNVRHKASFYNQSWSWKQPEKAPCQSLTHHVLISVSEPVFPPGLEEMMSLGLSITGTTPRAGTEGTGVMSPSTFVSTEPGGGQNLPLHLSSGFCLLEQYEPLVCHKLNPYNAIPLNLHLWWSCRCLESQARPTLCQKCLSFLERRAFVSQGFR